MTLVFSFLLPALIFIILTNTYFISPSCLNEMCSEEHLQFSSKVIWMPKPFTQVQTSIPILKRRYKPHLFNLAHCYYGLQTKPLNTKA